MLLRSIVTPSIFYHDLAKSRFGGMLVSSIVRIQPPEERTPPTNLYLR